MELVDYRGEKHQIVKKTLEKKLAEPVEKDYSSNRKSF
jgi:hypothetical protein